MTSLSHSSPKEERHGHGEMANRDRRGSRERGRPEGSEGTEGKACRRRQEGGRRLLTAKEEDPYPSA